MPSSRDFLPAKDADLLAWSANYGSLLTASAAPYGIVPAQASSFVSLQTAFADALETATEPSTRTRGTIAAKNAARTPMKGSARELARIINAYPPITNQQRINLGLNPRSDEASPINPPTEAPVMEVLGAIGRTLKCRVHAIGSGRAKPEGVAGCSVFSFVGSAAPADITQWVFQGSSTRTSFDVEFPATVAAGAQVFLCAFWYSPRAQSGPACQPITAYLAGGVTGSQQQAA